MRIQEALEAISEGALDTTLNVNEFHGQQKKVAEAVNHIRQGLMSSVNESLKMKTKGRLNNKRITRYKDTSDFNSQLC